MKSWLWSCELLNQFTDHYFCEKKFLTNFLCFHLFPLQSTLITVIRHRHFDSLVDKQMISVETSPCFYFHHYLFTKYNQIVIIQHIKVLFRSASFVLGHQISWVHDFSPWSSSAMEAIKETKFGTEIVYRE